MHDRKRLHHLSELAGVELEPYPIRTSCSGIDFYGPGQRPIEFHRDGPAFVELVPLHVDGGRAGGGTVVFRGPPDVGQRRVRACEELGEAEDDWRRDVEERKLPALHGYLMS